MTPDSLSSWRTRLGLNKSGAAKALGLSRNALEAYEKGERRIPLYIALACSALAYGLPPMDGKGLNTTMDKWITGKL
jgi:DNA-binding XRE family transcriptional regulator